MRIVEHGLVWVRIVGTSRIVCDKGKYLQTGKLFHFVEKYEFMCVIDWGGTQYRHICSEKICSRRQCDFNQAEQQFTSHRHFWSPPPPHRRRRRSRKFKSEKLTIQIRLIHYCVALCQATAHNSFPATSFQSFLFYYFLVVRKHVCKKSGSSITSMEKVINKIDSTRVEWMMELPIEFASIDFWSQQHSADDVRDVCPLTSAEHTSRVCRHTYAYRCIHFQWQKQKNQQTTCLQSFEYLINQHHQYENINLKTKYQFISGWKWLLQWSEDPASAMDHHRAAHSVQQIEYGSLWFIQIK